MIDVLTMILLTLPLAVAGGWWIGYRRGKDRALHGDVGDATDGADVEHVPSKAEDGRERR